MTSARIIVGLVGIPFLLFGLGMTGYALHQTARTQSAQSWIETTATVDKVTLESHRSRNRKGRGSSHTYSVPVTYRYTWEGQEREGHAATLYDVRDNARSYHQAVHDRILAFVFAKRPMPCFVNPANPADAVLIREPRGGHVGFLLLFGLIFSNVGLPMTMSVLRRPGRSRVSAWLRSQHPDEPWRAREDWASGTLHPTNAGFPRGVTATALLWNVATWPVTVLALLNRPTLPNPMGWIVFLYPVLALLLAIWAVYEILHHRKFRGARLELETIPGVPGDVLRGRIAVPTSIQPAGGFVVKLMAQRWEEYRTSKGKRGQRQVEICSFRQVVKEKAEVSHRGSIIPFAIEIPAEQPVTDLDNPESGVRWSLQVEAKLPGVDLHHSYDVPVFRRHTA